MIAALLTLAALYLTICAVLALACCMIRARDNARVRAVRRRMRAELLEQIRIDHEFAAIVAGLTIRTDSED